MNAEALLLEAAASHGIDVDPHDVRAALDDALTGPELAHWARTNLHTDNFLTVDELAL